MSPRDLVEISRDLGDFHRRAFIISSIASPEKSDWPRCKACVSWYASSTNRMPPRASLIFLAVFIAVWFT